MKQLLSIGRKKIPIVCGQNKTSSFHVSIFLIWQGATIQLYFHSRRLLLRSTTQHSSSTLKFSFTIKMNTKYLFSICVCLCISRFYFFLLQWLRSLLPYSIVYDCMWLLVQPSVISCDIWINVAYKFQSFVATTRNALSESLKKNKTSKYE